jgi:hypothetical protein
MGIVAAQLASSRRVFSSRTGRKMYICALFFVLALPLLPPLGGAIGAGLFAATMASRLNDIGRSRWHALWLTAWFALAVVLGQSHAAVIALPLALIVLAIGVLPGQKQANRFGPVPPGFREWLGLWRTYRATQRSTRKYLPRIRALRTEQDEKLHLMREAEARLKAALAAGDASALGLRKTEFDTAAANLRACTARLHALNTEMKPVVEDWRRTIEQARERATFDRKNMPPV